MKSEIPLGTQSIRRALAILRIVAAGRDAGLSLQQVAQATGLSRPTVHRILQTLVSEGVAEQSPHTKRYLVGEQVPLLAMARSRRSVLEDVAAPILDRAARDLGDTVFLTIRTQMDTLCLARRLGTFPIQVPVIEVGTRRPLGVSSAGLAILASLPAEEAAEILAANTPRMAGFGADPAKVAAQVATSRARGYALGDPGLVPGTKAISVSAPPGPPHSTAVLTLAAIRKRLAPWREAAVVAILRKAADDIAAEMNKRKRRSSGIKDAGPFP
jgi:DNA-binding IclR family transcriptional regulator